MFGVALEVLTSLVLTAVAQASVSHNTFTVLEALADSVCPAERRLTEVQAMSELSCMATAARWGDCTGVSYHDNSKMCYICDTYQDTTGSFPTLAGATFYHRFRILPEGYTNVVAGHVLKIVPGLVATHSEAKSACAEWAWGWGALVKIDTIAKQEALRSFLLDPSNGLDRDRFWIQGTPDSGNMAVWKFDDGNLVTMTTDFWHPGQPDMSDECAYMHWFFEFYWDNFNCGELIGYICEMI